MTLFPFRRRQSGDTIVEVLISIGVISVVLVGAYMVSTHSSNTMQDNQERAQGQQYLQSQVELLRVYLQHIDAGQTTPVANTDYCMSSSGSLTSSSCTMTNGGASYHLSFQHGSADPNLYTFKVYWDSLLGGTDNESFVYRVYPTVSS